MLGLSNQVVAGTHGLVGKNMRVPLGGVLNALTLDVFQVCARLRDQHTDR